MPEIAGAVTIAFSDEDTERCAGAVVKITATFAVAGVATSPTVATLRVRTPAGVVTDYTGASFAATDAGVFVGSVALGSWGTWAFQAIGTGACAASTRRDCRVARGIPAPD